MNGWRVILQAELSGGGFWRPCLRYDVPGVVVPAHISIVACDHTSDSKALELHGEIVQRLRLMGPASEFYCGQPQGFGCKACDEPSCHQRRDARTAADDIHDALVRAGYRVFLDRFTGTQGRVFPHELAEAMADHGLVLLLETPSVFDSDWTKWELAFARRYRLGPIAVNFNNARRWRSATVRINESEDPLKDLSSPLLERVVRFVRDNYLGTAVIRRAYFETLVQLAAQSKQGVANAIDGGLMALTDSGNVQVGSVLPGAIPGRLRHVKRLVDSPIAGPRLLAGQHEHLRPRDRDDLRWLAKQNAVTLAGPASVFSAVRKIL